MPLPPPIQDYFDGNARLDAEAMLAPFADDAEVGDERQTHRGKEAIALWVKQASLAVAAVATPRTAFVDLGALRERSSRLELRLDLGKGWVLAIARG